MGEGLELRVESPEYVEFRISDCEFRNCQNQFWISECGLRICRQSFRISEFQLVVINLLFENPKFEIRNPKSFQYRFHNVIAIFIFMIEHDDLADQPEGCSLEANGHEEDT